MPTFTGGKMTKQNERTKAQRNTKLPFVIFMPFCAYFLFLASAPLFGQEWIEYANREDRFTCNFPNQPAITQITYRSQHEADLPARVYSASQGQSRYVVTVVDYTQAQRILTEKAKSCPAGAEPCL